MRVIAGDAKGIKLLSVQGKTTRPITDQVKEALFNILGNRIIDKAFLDLFAGTGAVGIEALSRGADHAVFLDTNFRAFKVIQQNLKITGMQDYGTVLKIDAFKYLRKTSNNQYDFIYIAPPQYKGIWTKALKELDDNPVWLANDSEIIVQIHPKEYQENEAYANFDQYDFRDYGDTVLIFYNRSLPHGND